MKAIVYTRYGLPDVLQLAEVDLPTPGEDEVLVRVQAVSINAMDWHLMRGQPAFARVMMGGLRRPKHPILGSDIAGRVEAVGRNVTQFQPGDEVFGGIGQGGFAEYAAVRASRLLPKPANVSWEAAAALPVAAVTALQALRDRGRIRPGQRVLINGASGGVGTFAVQLARGFGADVTAVCRTRNVDLVRDIGADRIIDYTREDFTRNGQQYDLIVDIAASRSVADYRRALGSQGICVVVGFSTLSHMVRSAVLGAWASRTGSQQFVRFLARLSRPDLDLLAGLLDAGKIVPVLDRCYPLRQAGDAMRYFGEEHARGKVILTVAAPDS
jgi:NADPH:quinone reductase-like Zn-dependent oxidoreductase